MFVHLLSSIVLLTLAFHQIQVTANQTTVVWSTSDVNSTQVQACLAKLKKENVSESCHKAAEDKWTTRLTAIQWADGKGTVLDASEKSCRGWFSMIHCTVRRSCELCTTNESTALEMIAKTKVLAVQASLCYYWKLPLNVTKSWCDFSANVFGLLIVTGSFLTLFLLTLGYLAHKWKQNEHAANRRIRQVTIKRVKSDASAKEEQGKVNNRSAKSQKTAGNKSTSSKKTKKSVAAGGDGKSAVIAEVKSTASSKSRAKVGSSTGAK